MKLEIARGIFLVGALGVTAAAAAAWSEPSTNILDTRNSSYEYCPQPLAMKSKSTEQLRPNSDLLLFMFGMTHSKR